MNIKGHFVKYVFKTFNPDNLDIKDPILSKALENWISPKIIPDEYIKKFRSIMSQLNGQLSDYSLESSIGRFITEKSYNQWMIDNKKLVKGFDNLKTKLILSYDTLVPFIKESNKELIDYIWKQNDKNIGKPSENFIIEINKKLIDLLPTKEDLYNYVSCKILVYKITDSNGTSEIIDSDKFVTQEIKNDLIKIISDTFDKLINFYNKEKTVRRNMLSRFEKEMNRICLLYFCRDIKDVVEKTMRTIYNEEYMVSPTRFIDGLNLVKNDLVKDVKTCIIT